VQYNAFSDFINTLICLRITFINELSWEHSSSKLNRTVKFNHVASNAFQVSRSK